MRKKENSTSKKTMIKISVNDFNYETIKIICDILNEGKQVEIKKERENIVVVAIERHALIKTPIGK